MGKSTIDQHFQEIFPIDFHEEIPSGEVRWSSMSFLSVSQEKSIIALQDEIEDSPNSGSQVVGQSGIWSSKIWFEQQIWIEGVGISPTKLGMIDQNIYRNV